MNVYGSARQNAFKADVPQGQRQEWFKKDDEGLWRSNMVYSNQVSDNLVVYHEQVDSDCNMPLGDVAL